MSQIKTFAYFSRYDVRNFTNDLSILYNVIFIKTIQDGSIFDHLLFYCMFDGAFIAPHSLEYIVRNNNLLIY